MSNKKNLILSSVALGGCVFASTATVDTTQVYSSGVPAIEYTFNSDGQAFTATGIPVNGITFGFNPIPPAPPLRMPLECCLTATERPPVCCLTATERPPTPTPTDLPPASEVPEPESGQFVVGGLALLIMSLFMRRYPRA